MKISHSEKQLGSPVEGRLHAADSPLFACPALLWVGDTEHPDIAPAWRTCQRSCDGISIRRSIAEALASPPRQTPSRIVIAQTNRHERGCWAIDGPDSAELREHFPNGKMLVLRGPLVAPTVRLPATGDSAQHQGAPVWIESVSLHESLAYLPHWLAPSRTDHPWRIVRVSADRQRDPTTTFVPTAMSVNDDSAERMRPVVVVAARYAIAETLIDTIALLDEDSLAQPLIQWQRRLTSRSGRGFATVIWDESVANPESTQPWHDRCRLAPDARHVWMTGMATPQQRRAAREQGVHQVLDKPGRLECLMESVQAV